ncbi:MULTISPECIES: glycosyltransferase family 4 protein [Clostridia]|uniref:glycosyltransferase family 4 protein n=1 Tax=Clostridia TaxID=186801 RepID=UPI000EA13D19|nr:MULTISPECIES: glycosyltransferase family 4 protein [Clostridia]NBJ70845.1 glycosyltransferase family 1 protein [Roseburia sp. 1XD42-34]RKI75707.1 glycosyltransferase family 1 protein [Clostridium sp. 1xD42-85]
MAKILILANNDVGLYKFRKELIKELVINNDVYISLPYGDLVPELKKMGCKYIDTTINRRGTNPLTDLKLLITYIKLVKKCKPDIILTYTIKPNIYGGIASRINGVSYVANITGLGSAVENNGWLQKITLFLYRISLKKAKCVFFQNNENKDLFVKKNVVSNRFKIIPGSGVNLDDYPYMEYPTNEKVHFLFVARIMKEKGIEEYLNAAKHIKSKYDFTEFHILGYCEEAYKDRLEDMHKKGIINYHGMQKDVKPFYKKAHCIIHPTFYPEGMSNVLLEASACGRPIITTNRSGCKEIVDHGRNGLIIDPCNTSDLLRKIEKFIQLDNKTKLQMGLQSRRIVEKKFDRQIVVHKYLEEIY